MGSSSSKQNGLVVRLENQCYVAGTEVRGVALLQLKEAYPGTTVFLKIKGSHNVEYKQNFKKQNFKQPIYREKLILFDYKGNFMPPGQYQFPFSFMLDRDLPGTFYDENNNFTASIQYTLTASLPSLSSHIESFQNTVELNVQERVCQDIRLLLKGSSQENLDINLNLKSQTGQSYTLQNQSYDDDYEDDQKQKLVGNKQQQQQINSNSNPLSQFDIQKVDLMQQFKYVVSKNCFGQQVFWFKSQTSKELYQVDKPVMIKVDLDNLRCKTNMNKIIFTLYSRCIIKIPEMKGEDNKSVVQREVNLVNVRKFQEYEFEGIKKKSAQIGENARIFNLEFAEYSSKSSKLKQQDKKFIRFRPSIINSNIIKNEYYVQIQCVFEPGCCCSQNISPQVQHNVILYNCSDVFNKEINDLEGNKMWQPKIYDRKIIHFQTADVQNSKESFQSNSIEVSLDQNTLAHKLL